VVVVNEQFVRKYFPSQNPLGKRLRLGGREGPWAEIVGVARQSKYVFLAEPPLEMLYRPFWQNPRTGMALLVETYGPPAQMAGRLRDLVRRLDPDQPMFAVRTMPEYFHQRATQVMNLLTRTFGAMALLGLVLALVGLYGLMTYSVSRRTREIGIRMAVGAGHLEVVRMVLRQGLWLAGVGVGIGLTLSWLLSRALRAGLALPSFDPALVAAVSIGLLAVAALGAYLPARRASLVDPLTVLRQD
jgi:predicted lysophospholipase L1 biosynthesis ABC-type transport system permease subunit